MRLLTLLTLSAFSLANPAHPFRRWNPANLRSLFQTNSINAPTVFGGSVTINKTPPQYWVTPEQFGAYGDNSHDDTTAINNAISALLTSALCTQTVTCELRFQAKTYKTTAPVTLAGSYVTIVGQGMFSTFISNTATTGDGLDITGTGSNCATGAAFWNTVKSLQITRPNAATAGVGLNILDACWTKISDVQLTYNYIGLNVSSSGQTVIQDTQESAAAGSPYGFQLSGGLSSTYIRRGVYDGTLNTNHIGLYMSSCPSDTFISDFTGAHGAYGIQVNGSTESGVSICNGDVHLDHPVLDSCLIACIQINNLNSGGLAAVDIDGGYASTLATGIDLENVSGASVRGVQIRNGTGASGTIGLNIAGGSSNADIITGNVIQQVITCVSVNGSGNHIITGNTCTAISAQPITTGFNFVSLTNSIVRNNVMGGSFTTSFSFDSGSNNNTADGNNGFAYSTVSNSGAGNNFGFLGSYTISGLPSCGSSIVGAKAAISNGLATVTFQLAVSTTGSTIQPVTCLASGWVYQ
jgi:hypothetical protein